MNCPQSVSERVIQMVAIYSNGDPLELPPLYDSIDPDALEAYVDSLDEGEVSFRYAGHGVTVQGDGTVEVTEEPISCSR